MGFTPEQQEAIDAEVERRLTPVIALHKKWKDNYFTGFARELGRALYKARSK